MNRLRSNPAGSLAVILGIVSAAERFVLWAVYGPVSYGDTGSYFRSAVVLRGWTLDGYDGTRVPGYPAFVALLGAEPSRVYAGQLFVGWLLTMLLFYWMWRASRNAVLAVIVAGLYTFVPGTFLFEANLLTETLTAFLLVASFVLLFELGKAPTWLGRGATAVALGLTSGAVGLVRILLYPLTIWLVPFVWSGGGGRWTRRAARTVLFLVPGLALLLGWVGYIYTGYGFLSPTTMGGYNLVQHTGAFFELLPDDDAAIRDTYLRYRDARIAERGDQTNTIWEAIPELTEVSGLGFYDLSRELQRLSLRLIREHPDLYLRNVAEGWIDFWKAPVYWEPSQAKLPAVVAVFPIWASLGRAVTLAANLIFLLSSIWIVVRFRRFRDLLGDQTWLAPWGFIWATSILQTIADHGDNPRFLIPLQPVLFFVVGRYLGHVLQERKAEQE
ncbi:MAG TPA: hypothetical protein VLL77_00275 [Anaerolineales bacterium]|nr:hypothetical protein [Anaerolineales bacterium]